MIRVGVKIRVRKIRVSVRIKVLVVTRAGFTFYTQ